MARAKMSCPQCGAEMNYHAEKLVYESGSAENRASNPFPWNIEEVHACPACGTGLMTKAVPENQE